MIDNFFSPCVRLVWRKDYKAYHPDSLSDYDWVKHALGPSDSRVRIPIDNLDRISAYISQFGYSLETVGGPEEDA